MSEDSIASDTPSLRADPGASLPPRKRLLAGFKHTTSPSSPSCPCPLDESLVKPQLDDLDAQKQEELDENSVEDSCKAADQAEESAVSNNARLRKSRCQSVSTRTNPKRTKKRGTKPSQLELDPQAKPHSVKDEATNVVDSEELAVLSDDRADCGATTLSKYNGDVEDAVSLKFRGKIKQEKVAADETVKMQKLREQDSCTSLLFGVAKPRRNPSRYNHSKNKDVYKKQEAQLEKSVHVSSSLSDEELARQLHRAMNSSPRISRCLNYKDGPLLSLNR